MANGQTWAGAGLVKDVTGGGGTPNMDDLIDQLVKGFADLKSASKRPDWRTQMDMLRTILPMLLNNYRATSGPMRPLYQQGLGGFPGQLPVVKSRPGEYYPENRIISGGYYGPPGRGKGAM